MAAPVRTTATKAHYAGTGAALGAAIAEIFVHLVPDLQPVESAVNIILTAAVAWGLTFIAPANRAKP